MKIVVTGSSGMVGTNIKGIVEQYPEHEFTFISRSEGPNGRGINLTNRTNIFHFFSSHYFDACIHLAANVGGLYKNETNNIRMFSDNIAMNENVIDACHKYGVKRGIFVLSSCIYTPHPSKFPMDETMIHEGPPHNSNEGYAYAKRMLEMQCRNYNKAYDHEYICVIPVNLFGPYDNFNIKDAHLIPAVMHRWYNAKKNNEDKFLAYGTGAPLRQFLYAPDFAKLICNLLTDGKYKSTQPLICCDDKEYTIRKTLETLAEVMEIDKNKIKWDMTKSDGCMRKTVTNEKLKLVYPNLNLTSLRHGLFKSYNWFKDNYDEVRGAMNTQ